MIKTTLKSLRGKKCFIRAKQAFIVKTFGGVELVRSPADGVTSFDTETGVEYLLAFC